ncbi:MAG: hypothetical protein UW63_C0012G0020 [Candidatus Uhrbacteria bacterium GW2011_GWF2_44_350]|uniref:Uncharacterized protein n=1 Tax=Candidatus Uhrbacteria bacterium GW2011_GWF2_44_350 TaxID=1619000 RepID=A0A0G1JJ79_9BACT|nr:MAG: hypothetical protein UW63_C0012G0020 [Candidatus Uhrbacteria bacterium GW2011_GWF2_44_350]HBR80079.1 hypothetical protein [Candidatus Uhrbacteria bacterium]
MALAEETERGLDRLIAIVWPIAFPATVGVVGGAGEPALEEIPARVFAQTRVFDFGPDLSILSLCDLSFERIGGEPGWFDDSTEVGVGRGVWWVLERTDGFAPAVAGLFVVCVVHGHLAVQAHVGVGEEAEVVGELGAEDQENAEDRAEDYQN